MLVEEAACDATRLESIKENICAFAHILEISHSFRAACNIFLVEAPAGFRYAPVFCEKTPISCLKQRCLLGTVHLRGA